MILKKNLQRHSHSISCKVIQKTNQFNFAVPETNIGFDTEYLDLEEEPFSNSTILLSDPLDNNDCAQDTDTDRMTQDTDWDEFLDLPNSNPSDFTEEEYPDRSFGHSFNNMWHPFKNKIEAVIYIVLFCQKKPCSFESMKKLWVIFDVMEIDGIFSEHSTTNVLIFSKKLLHLVIF
jgi:hypothetical protein